MHNKLVLDERNYGGNSENVIKTIQIDSSDAIFWSLVDHRPTEKQEKLDIPNEYIAKMNLLVDEVYTQLNQNKDDIFVNKKNYIGVTYHKQIFQYLAKKYFNGTSLHGKHLANNKIANYIGKDSHATVIHNSNYIKNILSSIDSFGGYIRDKVISIEVELRQKLYGESKKLAIAKVTEDYGDIQENSREIILDINNIKKIEIFITMISQNLHISRNDLLGSSHQRQFTLPRQIMYYLMKEHLVEIPYRLMGFYTGGKSVSAVVSGHRRVQNLLYNKNFQFQGKPLANIVIDLETELGETLYGQTAEATRPEIIKKYQRKYKYIGLATNSPTDKQSSTTDPLGSLGEIKNSAIEKFHDIKKILGIKLYKDAQIQTFWAPETLAGITGNKALEHIRYLFLTNNNAQKLFDVWRKEIIYNTETMRYIEHNDVFSKDKIFHYIKTIIDKMCLDIVLEKVASAFDVNTSDIISHSIPDAPSVDDDIDDDIDIDAYDKKQKNLHNSLNIIAAKESYNFVIENYYNISKNKKPYNKEKWRNDRLFGSFNKIDIWAKKFFNAY